jgi:hypothetical protein
MFAYWLSLGTRVAEVATSIHPFCGRLPLSDLRLGCHMEKTPLVTMHFSIIAGGYVIHVEP